MSSNLFADISSYQTVSSWQAYANWSSRVLLKASEGVGFKDSKFESFWSGASAQALEVGIYHYARPDLNPGAAGAGNEARWFTSVIGMRITEALCMLDFEQNESAAWAHAWHDAIAWPSGVKPVIYDSVSHFNQFFAGDLSLAQKFDCALASWHSLEQGPPAPPPGWMMMWWQYADNEQVPGIGKCDANLWLGGGPPMTYTKQLDGSILCDNGNKVEGWIAAHLEAAIPDLGNWPFLLGRAKENNHQEGDTWLQAFEKGVISQNAQDFNTYGWQPPAAPPSPPTGTAKLIIDETSIRAVIA